MGRLLFILDLNGTVLSRLTRSWERALIHKHPKYRLPDCSVRGNHIYLRPHLDSFLQRLLRLGSVAVWTSALPKNALPMVLHSFNGLLDLEALRTTSGPNLLEYLKRHASVASLVGSGSHSLRFIWTQEECKVLEKVSGGEPEFLKDLDKVWRAFPEYSALNTVMIDDSEEKLVNHRRNLVKIPEYIVTDAESDFTTDSVLRELGEYLSHLHERGQNCAGFDVRLYLESNPFKHPQSNCNNTR